MKDRQSRNSKWPERHGFSIGGHGPSYVLSVAKGSAADKQGLKLGDQIIEMNGTNVREFAAPALETFAKHTIISMPKIKVINDVQHLELHATRLHSYGFSLAYSDRHGYIIDNVVSKSPADKAGLQKGEGCSSSPLLSTDYSVLE